MSLTPLGLLGEVEGVAVFWGRAKGQVAKGSTKPCSPFQQRAAIDEQRVGLLHTTPQSAGTVSDSKLLER